MCTHLPVQRVDHPGAHSTLVGKAVLSRSSDNGSRPATTPTSLGQWVRTALHRPQLPAGRCATSLNIMTSRRPRCIIFLMLPNGELIPRPPSPLQLCTGGKSPRQAISALDEGCGENVKRRESSPPKATQPSPRRIVYRGHRCKFRPTTRRALPGWSSPRASGMAAAFSSGAHVGVEHGTPTMRSLHGLPRGHLVDFSRCAAAQPLRSSPATART